MPGWVPTNSFFSSGAAFLSLGPSITKGYYITDGVFAVQQLYDPYLSASEASFSQWDAIQIHLPLPL